MTMTLDATAMELTDRELLAAYLARQDEEAFTRLVDRHQGMVRAVCRRIAGEAECEDCTQAVFLVLAMRGRTLTSFSDVGGWLHQVARHVALRQRSAARSRRQREAAAATRTDMSDESQPSEALAEHLDEALDRLPETLRLPLVLHYLESLPLPTVAKRLTVSPKALAMRLSRGRAQLQMLLARRGIGLSESTLMLAAGLSLSASGCNGSSASIIAKAAGSMGHGPVGTLAQETMRALAWAKAKAVAGVAAACLAAGLVLAGGALALHGVASEAPAASDAVPFTALAGVRFEEHFATLKDGRCTVSDAWIALLHLDSGTRLQVDRTLQSTYNSFRDLLQAHPPTVVKAGDETWTLTWPDLTHEAKKIGEEFEAGLMNAIGMERWKVLRPNMEHRLYGPLFLADKNAIAGQLQVVTVRRLPQAGQEGTWQIDTTYSRGSKSGSSTEIFAAMPSERLRVLLAWVPPLAAWVPPRVAPPAFIEPASAPPAGVPQAVLAQRRLSAGENYFAAKNGVPTLSPKARVVLGLDDATAASLDLCLASLYSEWSQVLAAHPPTIIPWKGDGHELQFADLRAELAPLRQRVKIQLTALLGKDRAEVLAESHELGTWLWEYGDALQIVRLREAAPRPWAMGENWEHASSFDRGGRCREESGSGGTLPEHYAIFLQFLPKR